MFNLIEQSLTLNLTPNFENQALWELWELEDKSALRLETRGSFQLFIYIWFQSWTTLVQSCALFGGHSVQFQTAKLFNLSWFKSAKDHGKNYDYCCTAIFLHNRWLHKRWQTRWLRGLTFMQFYHEPLHSEILRKVNNFAVQSHMDLKLHVKV